MKLTKKDIIYSLIIGEVSSWFFIFIVKNPYIEEFKSIGLSPVIIWSLPIVFPVVFLIGTFIAKLLSKNGSIVLTTFITPYAQERRKIRKQKKYTPIN